MYKGYYTTLVAKCRVLTCFIWPKLSKSS